MVDMGCLTMALVALKTYYVREMIAALVIFSALFGIVALVVLGFFALDRVRQRTFACAGPPQYGWSDGQPVAARR